MKLFYHFKIKGLLCIFELILILKLYIRTNRNIEDFFFYCQGGGTYWHLYPPPVQEFLLPSRNFFSHAWYFYHVSQGIVTLSHSIFKISQRRTAFWPFCKFFIFIFFIYYYILTTFPSCLAKNFIIPHHRTGFWLSCITFDSLASE